MSKLENFTWTKIGYNPYVPFLFYEGSFGRLDIFLKDKINITNIDNHPLPYKEIYLNSRKVDAICLSIKGGEITLETHE
jgi:hypothetical protein